MQTSKVLINEETKNIYNNKKSKRKVEETIEQNKLIELRAESKQSNEQI